MNFHIDSCWKYLNKCDCEKFGPTVLAVGHGDEEEERVERPDEVEQLRLRQRMLAQVVRIERVERFKLWSNQPSFRKVFKFCIVYFGAVDRKTFLILFITIVTFLTIIF